MAEDRQPATVVEGAASASAADIDEETQPVAKSAEDRKAAAALSKLDASHGDEGAAGQVDHEAAANALSAIAGTASKKEVKKVKVDAADVNLLVEELELSKPKATELLKSHDGDAVKALKAYLQPEL